MQKKLIALAITAAFSAPAFADTNIYGVVDAGFGSVTNTHTTTAGVSSKTGQSAFDFSQLWTTRFGIKSVEDLGNGMKATAVVETNIAAKNAQSDAGFGSATVAAAPGASTAPTATTLGDRILDVNLNFGQGTSVHVGKTSSPLRGIAYGYDAFYGSNLIGNLVTMDGSLTARMTGAGVAHTAGPFTVTFDMMDNTRTADGAADAKTGNGFELTGGYKQNALSVSAGYRSLKTVAVTAPTTTADATTKDLILAASYDFGMAKLYGQYATVTVDTSVPAATASTKKTYETVGVNVPFTSTLAGYVQTSFGKNDTGTDSPKMSAYAVGAKYDFSKSTFAYGDVGSAKSDQTAITAGSKVDQIAFGLVHSF